MNTVSYIEEKISRAKDLDFGTIFTQSIDLFKKTWIQGFLMQLFLIVLMLPFIILFYIPFIMMIFSESQSGTMNSDVYGSFFAGFSILYIILFVVGMLVLSAVSVCLNAALYRIIKEIDHGNAVKTNDFFIFLKGKYLSKAFVLLVVSMLIAIPSALLCYLPLLYVMVPMSFFAVIFAFNPELGVGDIVKLSFKLGHKKWLLAFGLLIVSSFLASIVGMLLCGIGTLFTSAFVYHPMYHIYKEVIGFEPSDEIDTIGYLTE
jgi:hypothetical protein